MQINGNSIFMGAYAERMASKHPEGSELTLSSERSIQIEEGIKQAAATSNLQNRGVRVSVSKENMDFLCSEKGFQKMKQDAADIYSLNMKQQQKLAEGRDPGDKFWNNTGDQWLTFSGALNNGGFYDGMSDEEVKNFEGLLEQITSGMDSLSKSQFNTGIDFGTVAPGGKYFMSSAEAAVSLEASTAALQYMSEKLMPDHLKDEFNGLIDMYKKHNEEILSEYQSPMESFNKVVAGISKAGENFLSTKPVDEFKYTVMLGETENSEEDKADFRKDISEIFKNYGMNGDIKTAISMAKERFSQFVTNDSEDEDFQQYVRDEADHIFSNIQGYWEKLRSTVQLDI